MIERKFVSQNIKEFKIKKFLSSRLKNVGLSEIQLKRTPLGDKIIIHALRPGLVVGRAGSTISLLTKELKENFELDNPQIELEEVKNPYNDPNVIVETIVSSLERFGTQRFKGIGHKVITDVMNSGALGVEVLISGKIPSSRAKTWRFYQGYLKKCGDISISGVKKAQSIAILKSGVVGIHVSILPGDIHLSDKIKITEEITEKIEEVNSEDMSEAQKELLENVNKIAEKETKKASKEKQETKTKKKTTKKTANKKTTKKKTTAKKETKKASKEKQEKQTDN